VRIAELAAEADGMLFLSDGKVHFGTHQELLLQEPAYTSLWEQRLAGDEVDLSVLGIPDEARGALITRLVTEQYAPGETIYRQGDDADRVIFTIAGKIEISSRDSEGVERRVAVIGPGNHCGDLRLAAGEQRAETATALESSIVRALSREALAAGMSAALDRTPEERRIVTTILRHGPSTRRELSALIFDLDADAIDGALSMLLRDGALREADGQYSMVLQKTAKRGASDVFDRLGGF
jgi:hypothetical protein